MGRNNTVSSFLKPYYIIIFYINKIKINNIKVWKSLLEFAMFLNKKPQTKLDKEVVKKNFFLQNSPEEKSESENKAD